VDDEALERAWTEIVEHWDDQARHERFVALGDALDRLPEIARRYRAVKEANDARGEVATHCLDAITRRALSRMSSTPRQAPPTRSRLEWIAFGVSVALGAAALWQVLRAM